MAHGDKDARVGRGQVMATGIRQPTITIDTSCACSWVVVKAGPGLECISEMKYRNNLCLVRHVQEPVPAVFRAS